MAHYIIDLHLDVIEDPESLAAYLDQLVGVVEHGLFLNMVTKVIVGADGGVTVLIPLFKIEIFTISVKTTRLNKHKKLSFLKDFMLHSYCHR